MYCPHDNAQILGQCLDQVPLLAILKPSDRESPQTTGLTQMRKRPLHQIRPLPAERFSVLSFAALLSPSLLKEFEGVYCQNKLTGGMKGGK